MWETAPWGVRKASLPILSNCCIYVESWIKGTRGKDVTKGQWGRQKKVGQRKKGREGRSARSPDPCLPFCRNCGLMTQDPRSSLTSARPPIWWLPGDCTPDHSLCRNVALFTDQLLSKYLLVLCQDSSESGPGRYPYAVEVVMQEAGWSL